MPPDTGIVHQVNLEYLARVVFVQESNGKRTAYPDTLVGTDSHTTMINGLGVLGWGVGGIEAEAAMLGQPVSMLIPQVVGVKLTGTLARRRDCHRSCAHHHRNAAQAWRGGKVRRILWPGTAGLSAGRPRHHRQHVAGVRRHLRHFPGRQREVCTTCVSPAAPKSRSRWSRPTAASRACSTTRKLPRRNIPNC